MTFDILEKVAVAAFNKVRHYFHVPRMTKLYVTIISLN